MHTCFFREVIRLGMEDIDSVEAGSQFSIQRPARLMELRLITGRGGCIMRMFVLSVDYNKIGLNFG